MELRPGGRGGPRPRLRRVLHSNLLAGGRSFWFWRRNLDMVSLWLVLSLCGLRLKSWVAVGYHCGAWFCSLFGLRWLVFCSCWLVSSWHSPLLRHWRLYRGVSIHPNLTRLCFSLLRSWWRRSWNWSGSFSGLVWRSLTTSNCTLGHCISFHLDWGSGGFRWRWSAPSVRCWLRRSWLLPSASLLSGAPWGRWASSGLGREGLRLAQRSLLSPGRSHGAGRSLPAAVSHLPGWLRR